MTAPSTVVSIGLIATLAGCSPRPAPASPAAQPTRTPPATTAKATEAPATSSGTPTGAPAPAPAASVSAPPPSSSDTQPPTAAAPDKKVTLKPRPSRAPGSDGPQLSPESKRVIRRYASRFRRCYSNTLKSDPKLEGRVEFTVHVDQVGRVTRVDVSPSSTLPRSLISCLTAVLKGVQFAPPEAGDDTFTVPLTFQRTP